MLSEKKTFKYNPQEEEMNKKKDSLNKYFNTF